ncbi:MAG: Fe-S cluster assembly protein SufB [Candidatus Azosocius agrarius]|nr:MAG: Fe-S cluster assembly protein SufB [Gammaproteobacteria bacterium]
MSKLKNIEYIINKKYKYGFTTKIKSYSFIAGISKNIIYEISKKKQEPKFLLVWRLKAYYKWLQMKEPTWGNIKYKKINYQNIIYYSSPKIINNTKNIKKIDPEIIKTYNKLGIPINEQKKLQGIAIDAVFDSVSIITTFKKELLKSNIIFCSFSEAIKKYPYLINKYLGSVVSYNDNFFSTLNSAVFSDGSFCYIPKNIKCPLELSTYFRINTVLTGQFERTLIIADKNSYVSYLEGCTAPIRNDNQLHSAVVEIIILDNAEVKYATIQNWYPGNKNNIGGIYNFVTKRGKCIGKNAKLSWTQIETGSSITWKYPSIILKGKKSNGNFYSITLTNHFQQNDTGSKILHLGNNTSSIIISKAISLGFSKNTYRGLIKIDKNSNNAKNYTQCDSLIIDNNSNSYTFPKIETKNKNCQIEHEASISKINEKQLFYCLQRGLNKEEAIAIIVNGFCKQILKKLPIEFSVEAHKLLNIKLEGSIG